MCETNYVKGKVVLITGASSGFGKLVAEKVAAMGGIPVVGARREEQLKQRLAGQRGGKRPEFFHHDQRHGQERRAVQGA